MEQPPSFHLFRLTELARSAGSSILHMAAGEQFVALATLSNSLLLLAPGSSVSAPITRQLHWFSEPLKGVASMDLHDEVGLLIASHDASALVLPVKAMLRRPRCPIGEGPAAPGGVLSLPGLTVQLDGPAAPRSAEKAVLVPSASSTESSRSVGEAYASSCRWEAPGAGALHASP